MYTNIISSLSRYDNDRLIRLSDQLIDVLNQKDTLIKEAEKLVDQMNIITKKQDGLDKKSSEIINLNGSVHIKSALDSEELMNILIKSTNLSDEINDIRVKSADLNKRLEEISKIENEINNEISLILSSVNEKDDKEPIYVENVGHVHIVDRRLMPIIEKVNPYLCEIINCSIPLITQISDLYHSNITIRSIEPVEDEFVKLKEKVDEYNDEKSKSESEQLQILSKVSSKQSLPKVEEKKEEVQPQENIIDEKTKLQLQDELPDTEDKVEEPEVKLEVLNNQQSNDANESLLEVEEKKEEAIDNISVPSIDNLIENSYKPIESILSSDSENDTRRTMYFTRNVQLNQIAKATKDKLYNKIMLIFDGSFDRPNIQMLPSINETNQSLNVSNQPFNFENFVSKDAA